MRGLGADGAPCRHESAFWPLPTLEAEARAIELLIGCLSPAQREQYESSRYFDVVGGDSGKRYRIRHGSQMNVEQLDRNGHRTQSLCFVPEGELPIGDVMLAQKIALERFETEAIRIANRSPNCDLDYAQRWARRYRI